MKQHIRKQLVIDGAKRRLSGILAEYRERIEDLRAVTLENDLAETASQTEGRRDADIELMNTMGEKLEQVQRDLETLDQVEPQESHEEVRFGSVVHTDQRDLLVAVGVEEFDVDGRAYLGLSMRAPLYQAISGRRAGETVSFNGIDYTINEVF